MAESTGRLVMVSNRLGRAVAPGGLALVLSEALRTTGGMWFGWDGEAGDGPSGHARTMRIADGVEHVGMTLSDADRAGYYDGYSNAVLWPAFHGQSGLMQYREADYRAYQRVNLQFVIDNPNSVEIRSVEFSNELPGDLQYVDAVTGADGRINQQTTDSGATLILAARPSIPAGGIVTVTITVNVSPDLPDAAVIDNLVAVRASNGMYTTGGISIGMPPTEFPDFQ